MIEFDVPGKIVAWARTGGHARMTKDGRPYVQRFNKPEQRAYQSRVIDAFLTQSPTWWAGMDPGWFTAAWHLEIIATFARPKSHFTSKDALKSGAPSYPACKPDIDNIVKQVCDALTGVLWLDDAQVISVHTQKVYGERPGLRVVARVVKPSTIGTTKSGHPAPLPYVNQEAKAEGH